MDPTSAAALILAAVQLTGSCLKECRKHIGPSKYSSADVQSISEDLWALNGSLRNLQDHYEICEDGQARSTAFSSIGKPLSDCKNALGEIQKRLESNSFRVKYLTGVHFDTALREHLSSLKRSRILFHESLLNAVERYICNLAQDVRDLQRNVGKNDGRSRRDHEQMRQSLLSIDKRQKNILRSHKDSRVQKESQDQATKDRMIIDGLSPLNFWAKQSDVLSSRSGSTGAWILESREFKDWATGAGKILWCTGIPGAGKTVSTSIVVDHLSRRVRDPRVAISYVYCSYKDETIQTPASLIGSILQQILKRTMVVPDDLRALYERHAQNKTMPTEKELSVQLQASIGHFEKFFIVIDALDELPGVKRREFLDHIRKLRPSVNLMITTRPVNHVDNGFPRASCIEIQAKDTDIQSYCEAKIRDDDRLHFVQDDADLKKNVINTIVENAQKMFLLAVLHIESLASQLNKAQVRNALEKLPKKLDDTYHEALQRIALQDDSYIEVANQVLYWISYAYRPLPIKELLCALAVVPGHTTFDKEDMYPESTLVSVCAGLVTVDPRSGIIRLVHYTTQEFFEKIRDGRFPTAQADITLICLTYLSFDHPRYYETDCAAFRYDIKKSPFLSYAAQHWRDHMRASPESNFNELILEILSQPKKVQCILQAMDDESFESLLDSPIDEDFNVPPLCAAAILGLASVVPLLLERGLDSTESEMSDGKTAFTTAVYFAQQEVIKILIDCGAPINSHDGQGSSPLWETVSAAGLTSEEEAVAAARLLLDGGADVDIQGGHGMLTTSTLMRAAESGYVQLVELLLTYGADVKLRDDRGFTALHMAHRGTHRIFQLLVEYGADLHACEKNGNSTLLVVSAERGREVADTARVLLDLGADIHSRNDSGETALLRAATQGHCRLIQVLIEYGADIHARSELGPSALRSTIGSEDGRPAAKRPSEALEFLLDHKADIDTSNGAGDTALPLAAAAEATLGRSERSGVEYDQIRTEYTLDHQWRVIRNKAGDTALTLVAASGNLGAVKLLLDHGANAHEKNAAGDTALSLMNPTEIPQSLLERLS